MAFSELFSFLAILKESIFLLPKNGKLMAFIAICSIVINSCIFLLFNCSLQSLMRDMFAALSQPSADPSSSSSPYTALLDQMKEFMALILADDLTFHVAMFIVSVFLCMATILVSATSYTDKDKTLSFKELFSIIRKTFMRTLVVTIYVAGLAIGYFFSFLMLVAPLLVLYPNRVAISFAIFLGIVGYVLYLYLSVAWILAIVVSVMEENSCGVHAIGRAGRLATGKWLLGFMIIFCFGAVSMIVSQGIQMIGGNKGLVNVTVYGVLMVSVSSLLKIWLMMAYTVFYFECKKHHGEEMSHHGSVVQYTKLLSDDVV